MDRRNTFQKSLVNKAIMELKHSTIPSILEYCKKEYPNISIATVYRNLEILEKENLIRRIPTIFKEDVYESTSKDAHKHFICKKCGIIFDMEKIELDKNRTEEGDIIESESLVYYGTCKDCLNENIC